MDPISALGMASSLVTFLEFSKSLVKTIYKTYKSGKDATKEALDLEQAYNSLCDFSSRLAHPSLQVPAAGEAALSGRSIDGNDAASLTKLAEQCRTDCEELLNILRKLRINGDENRLWQATKVALQGVWERHRMTEIQYRLEKSQATMALLVGNILRSQVSSVSEHLKRFREENVRLHMNQAAQLDSLTKGVEELKVTIPKEPPKGHSMILDADILNRRESTLPDSLESVRISAPGLEKQRSDMLALFRLEHEMAKEQEILASLDFESRSVRFESIPKAYEKTFEWILDSGFAEWLQQDGGIFWVSGKAGSGKSTLMKFIASHHKTQHILLGWSADKPVAIATHYFWAAGASIQNSSTGLFRTLLYDMFRQCPRCIPLACPDRWKQTGVPSVAQAMDRPERPQRGWTRSELTEALNILGRLGDLPTRFCFFIDGMDEYSGDHMDLCETLKALSRSTHIKLCVSSRPWNVFEDSFGQDGRRMLKVHELTRQDISTFARGRLESHPRWSAVRRLNSNIDGIVDTISQRAEGVFLWVFLVTKSLRDGLTNGDTSRELNARLDGLPTDLERLFKYMLNQVDPLYYQSMAGMFQLALHAHEPMRMDFYAYHDKAYDDEDFVVQLQVRERPVDEILDMYDHMRRRLNTQSNGLLECKDVSFKVEFLHRTVRDFLSTGEMNDYFQGMLKPDFDVFLALTSAYIAYTKSTRFRDGIHRLGPPSRSSGRFIDTLATIFEYASQTTAASLTRLARLLDELEEAIDDHLQAGLVTFNLGSYPCPAKVLFREELLHSDAAGYLALKLSNMPDYLSCVGPAPMGIAISGETIPINTIRLLLKNGEDPNRKMTLLGGAKMSTLAHLCFVSSPWSFAGFRKEPFNNLLDRGLHRLLLSYGADPNAIISDNYQLSAFGVYLMTVFCPADYITKCDEYLQTLDDFLLAGADDAFLVSLEKSFYERERASFPWWPPSGESQSILGAFFRGLQHWGETRDARKKNGAFIGEVVRRLLSHRASSGRDIDEFTAVLPKVLGEHLAMPLITKVKAVAKRKRPACQDEDGRVASGTACKRSKGGS